jgi:hypothetical protein
LADAALYGGSAIFAGLAAAFASIPLYREWGRIAAVPYAIGLVAAVVLASRGASVRARAWLAALVFMGAALLPLGLEVTWRAHTAPGLHVQSEAIVTEEAANALLDGRNPYAAQYLDGPLAARPLGTKTHFPYLPGMLIFGLPRGLDTHHPWADARVSFAAVTMVLAWAAIRRPVISSPARLRALQVLFVLPTGALLMATGGDDLPVLALLLLTLALASDGRFVPAGVALGLAMATKQTAWILLPFLGVGLAFAHGRRAARRFMSAAAAVALPVIAVFLAWDPGAFWENVVRFPLGLGSAATAAATPTLGSLLVDAFPSLRAPLTLGLVGVVVVLAAALLIRWPPRTVGSAALRAAAVACVVVALAPAARAGYVVYPIGLAVWGWLLAATASTQEASAERADTRLSR